MRGFEIVMDCLPTQHRTQVIAYKVLDQVAKSTLLTKYDIFAILNGQKSLSLYVFISIINYWICQRMTLCHRTVPPKVVFSWNWGGQLWLSLILGGHPSSQKSWWLLGNQVWYDINKCSALWNEGF